MAGNSQPKLRSLLNLEWPKNNVMIYISLRKTMIEKKIIINLFKINLKINVYIDDYNILVNSYQS